MRKFGGLLCLALIGGFLASVVQLGLEARSGANPAWAAPQTSVGYRLVASDGGIFEFDSPFYGSTGGTHLNQPIVAMASTPDGDGYWLVASDGGVFNFGDAGFHGSTGNVHLNAPIVGMAATPDGGGYWLVASDGGIFQFGDARYFGSTGNVRLNKPVVGMAATPDGGGYWLVASDGGIFQFGDAVFHGSTGSVALNRPIVGMAASPAGDGYWLVASDGGIFNFGTPYLGSTGAVALNRPIVGMAATPDGNGYWLVASDGGIFEFGDAPFHGSTGNVALNQPIVGITGAGDSAGCVLGGPQVAGDPYSPPCAAFGGDNGGSTSPGVSPTAITVAYRLTDSQSYGQTWAQLAGAQVTDTNATTEQTIDTLVDYFNRHFQFYGRKIQVAFYNGQGSLASEVQGYGQAQATADAATVRDSIGAFADISAGSQEYAGALASDGVMAFGMPTLPASFYTQNMPYAWSVQTDSGTLDSDLAAYLVNRVCGGTAAYAGGALHNQPRKIAVVAPEGDTTLQQLLTSDGCASTSFGYAFDLGTMSQQAANLVGLLKGQSFTTVVCTCDPVFPVYLTGQAFQQGYLPELVEGGADLMDRDYVGQLYNQTAYAHAFGVTTGPAQIPEDQTPGYQAYESIDPGGQPATFVDDIYRQLEQLAIGIEMAGPHLDPSTFYTGMDDGYGTHTGPAGVWSFAGNHFTVPGDFGETCWSTTATSNLNGRTGAYFDPTGQRYTVNGIQPGQPACPAP